MDGKPSLKGAWSGHVNRFNFGGRVKLEWSSFVYRYRLSQVPA